jgi:hypothetical protein
MPTKRSETTADVSPRLATPLPADPFRLAGDTPAVGPAPDQAQTNNERLIFYSHDVANEPDSLRPFAGIHGSHPRADAASKNASFAFGGGVAMCARLNAFFAISVNSASMSMVNFSCCVCSALTSGAFGVTRRVAPQPMRAAVRMEAGAHACL